MKCRKSSALGVALSIAFATCASQSPAAERPAAQPGGPVAGKQQACTFEKTIKVTLSYLLYLPKDYAEKDSRPLLLFLHGAGERGDDLELVKKHGPPKLIAAGKDFPFIVVSPQSPQGRWWQPFELTALVDEMVAK